MKHVLFICSRNRLRSPTAEQIFSHWPHVETDSAGLSSDAERPLEREQLAWATIIFVMEKRHKSLLTQRFGDALRGKRVICLDIADNYAFMQDELIELLDLKAGLYLR